MMESSNVSSSPESYSPESSDDNQKSLSQNSGQAIPAESLPLSRHAQREAERIARLEEHKKAREEAERKLRLRSWAWKFAGLGVVLLLAFLFYRGVINRPPSLSDREIHWHAQLDMESCGKRLDLPRTRPGQSHLGGVLLHTHDDNTVHVEGQPLRAEDITLGRFMDAVGVTFSESQLFEHKTGTPCPNASTPSTLKMFVNGEENTEFRAYVIKPTEDAKQQVIRLVLS